MDPRSLPLYFGQESWGGRGWRLKPEQALSFWFRDHLKNRGDNISQSLKNRSLRREAKVLHLGAPREAEASVSLEVCKPSRSAAGPAKSLA